jgi:hypothetical protein
MQIILWKESLEVGNAKLLLVISSQLPFVEKYYCPHCIQTEDRVEYRL